MKKTIPPTLLCLPFCLLFLAPLCADEIRFRDGTELKGCLVRDEGRIMRVWLKREDFPDRSRIYPRDEVERFRIERGPEWDAHPAIQDLSVTHIELSPPLVGLHGCYAYDPETGAPSLKARLQCAVPNRISPEKALAALPDLGAANRLEPENVVRGLKLTYEKGEHLTLTAHVKNTGFAEAAPFAYRWALNGKIVKEGRWDARLTEMETAEISLDFDWPGGDPEVRFQVLPGVEEIAAFNDAREETLSAWGFDFTVTKRRVAYAHEHRNTLGSFSWEDYYQWHLDLMNRLFAESIYPSAPKGIAARVRLNRIFYLDEVEDRTIDEKFVGPDGLVRNQGAWNFRDNEADKRGEWHRPFGQFFGCVTEWSLPHELGHQLGLIDLYNLDYHGTEAFPVSGRAEPLRFSHFFRHPRVMMHWHGPHPWHELSAAYFNRTKGMPRGAFGDYLFQTPERSLIQVLDQNHQPVAGAKVRIFQRGARALPEGKHVEPSGVTWYDVKENGRFESRFFPGAGPVIEGVTDEKGFMELPNRPVDPCRTLNGYERRPNPFGNMNVVGQRGLMLALVTKGERTDPFFLELTDFNLACVRGHEKEYIAVFQGDFPSEASPPPPACVRLEYREGGRWRLHWKKPFSGKDTTNRAVHRFHVYRRCGNEGLNFDPWDPVAVTDADVEVLDLPGFPDNPAHAVGARRRVYGISSVNERGVESGVVSCFAPEMGRVTGLIRGEAYGDFYLTMEGDINLVKLGPPGRYADVTPAGTAMEKAGECFDINGEGRMVSTAWDRHGVNLYEPGMKPAGGLGRPFEPGTEPGRFRNPRACAIDGAGDVAVADGENRRIQVFAAETAWGDAPEEARKPVLVVDRFGGVPFDARLRALAFDHGLLLAGDERGRLYGWKTKLAEASAREAFRLEIGGRFTIRVEDATHFLVLHHDRAWLRRYDGEGNLQDETDTLNGEKLKRPRGLVVLGESRVATFQDLNHLLVGTFHHGAAPKDASSLPALEGVYRNPRRWERPEITLKVLVINYEPRVPDGKGGEVLLHTYARWQDPHDLAEAYARELHLMSGGYLRCRIVEWQDVDGWPVKVDGFMYDDASYLEALRTRRYHDPDGMDYTKLVERHRLAERVGRGEIDEVWVFGAPGFGYYESRMVGPGAYWCNSTGLEYPAAERLFVIMGYNYERGLAEMIHDLGHRLESIMSRVYEKDFGPWRAEERRDDWERFSCVDRYVNGWAAVGNCHYPCNGLSDYDYANPRAVQSFAEDWLHYPDLTGRSSLVSCKDWSDESGNFHLGYMRWLFSHLPRAPGLNHEGKRCNWWCYLFDMSTYAETR